MAQLKINDRVETVAAAAYNRGRVHAIDGDQITVQWDSHDTTTLPARQLRVSSGQATPTAKTTLMWHPERIAGHADTAIEGFSAVTTLGDFRVGFPHLFPVEVEEGRFLDLDDASVNEKVDIFNGVAIYRTLRNCSGADCWNPVDVVLGHLRD